MQFLTQMLPTTGLYCACQAGTTSKKRSEAYLRAHTPRPELQLLKYAAQLLKYTINDAGCWIWTGSFFKDGYGQMKRHGKNLKAHRVFYAEYNGAIPDGLCVLHKCDTPACVNPAHLWAGTDIDNIHDRDTKDRCYKTSVPQLAASINIRKLARDLGVAESGLRGRLKRGWDLSRAMTQPFNISESKKINHQLAGGGK